LKKYEAIYKDLEKKITQGEFRPGDILPTEQNLREQYGASRDTVRKALQMLTEIGLITKTQGRGSVVTKRNQFNFPISGLTSYRELQTSQGFASKTAVIQLIHKKITPEDAARTQFKERQLVWHLLRTRQVEGKISVLDEDIILSDVSPELTKSIAEDSVYAYLEEVLNLDIAYAEKEITIQPINNADREHLDLLPKDINVVCVKSHVYLADGTLFQFTESRHQVDKFRFLDFAKRKKI